MVAALIKAEDYTDFSGSIETWNVFLTDKKNSIRYEATIDPYSGGVDRHNIRVWMGQWRKV